MVTELELTSYRALVILGERLVPYQFVEDGRSEDACAAHRRDGNLPLRRVRERHRVGGGDAFTNVVREVVKANILPPL